MASIEAVGGAIGDKEPLVRLSEAVRGSTRSDPSQVRSQDRVNERAASAGAASVSRIKSTERGHGEPDVHCDRAEAHSTPRWSHPRRSC